MASMQCNKPPEQSSHSQHQKHDQDHCFGHMSDKIKGVFRGHHNQQAPAAAPSKPHHVSANANACHCKPSAKKREEHKNKDSSLLHKIKDAFSDHSSDSSDSDNEGHKPHHKRKN